MYLHISKQMLNPDRMILKSKHTIAKITKIKSPAVICGLGNWLFPNIVDKINVPIEDVNKEKTTMTMYKKDKHLS